MIQFVLVSALNMSFHDDEVLFLNAACLFIGGWRLISNIILQIQVRSVVLISRIIRTVAMAN